GGSTFACSRTAPGSEGIETSAPRWHEFCAPKPSRSRGKHMGRMDVIIGHIIETIRRLGLRRSVLIIAAQILAHGFLAQWASAATLDEIKQRHYMIVATEDDYPPFEYVVNGTPMGYDH